MQTNLLWTGREYYSLENCLMETTTAGSEISSTIVGLYEGKLYKVEYRIRTNQHWETVFLEINSRHSNQTQLIQLEGDGKGNWMLNGKQADQFSGCINVDIPVTPFTNTLPHPQAQPGSQSIAGATGALLRRSGTAAEVCSPALHLPIGHRISLRKCSE